MRSDSPITLVLNQCAEADQSLHMEWVAGNNIEKWATNKRKSRKQRLGATKSNVSYLELFLLQEGWYWPNTCSVPQREVTQLICIYVGTTQQSPARVFANPHPPVSAILKTASNPFSDSSTNYIPHQSRHAINSYQRPPRPRRPGASFINESKLAWGMGVLGGRKHAWMSSC